MTESYVFPRKMVEVIRIIDNNVETYELQEFIVKMIDEQEHVRVYEAWRPVHRNEDGVRYVAIELESLPKIWVGVDAFKLSK